LDGVLVYQEKVVNGLKFTIKEESQNKFKICAITNSDVLFLGHSYFFDTALYYLDIIKSDERLLNMIVYPNIAN